MELTSTFLASASCLLAYDPRRCSAVRRILVLALLAAARERAAAAGVQNGRSGSIGISQRSGGALILDLHFHVLALCGVHASSSPLEPPVFHAAPPPTDQDDFELSAVLHRLILEFLVRHGWSTRSEHDASGLPRPDEPLVAHRCAASVQRRLALGPETGRAVERLGRRPSDPRPRFVPGALYRDVEQLPLHARVRMFAYDRQGLERLCRHVARPPFRADRLSLDEHGRFVLAPADAGRDDIGPGRSARERGKRTTRHLCAELV